MKIQKIAGATAALFILTTLFTGCASNTPNGDAKMSGEPTNSASPSESNSPAPSETNSIDPISYMEKGKARIIQNDLDEEFLTIAQRSCTKALEDGLIHKNSINVTYFQQSTNSESVSYWPLSQVTVAKEGKLATGIYVNYLPAFFDPCDMMIQGALLEDPTDSKVLEHSLKKNKDGSYYWGQHHGGESFDFNTYRVGDDGLFSWVGDNIFQNTVSYGPLTQEQLDYFE